MIMLSSNKEKIEEYNDLKKILNIKELSFLKIPSVKEIDSDDYISVMTYKALELFKIDDVKKLLEDNDKIYFEDAHLILESKALLDVKFKLKYLKNNSHLKWNVVVGEISKSSTNTYFLSLFIGTTIGYSNKKFNDKKENTFGFNDYFIPKNETLSLHGLKIKDKENYFVNYSARKKALVNVISNKFCYKRKIDFISMKPWAGNYQGEGEIDD